jgi:diguanylate cyclase (GGDEF)-like protein/PAS domain S-box-containing protein
MRRFPINEDFFLSVLKAASEAIILVDKNGRIVDTNLRAEKCFGFTRTEIIGKKIEQLIPHRFRKAHDAHRRQFNSSPELRPMGENSGLLALNKWGEEFPVDIGLSPIKIQDREFVIAVIRDLTHGKGIEKQWEQTKADLERAVRERTARLEKANAQLLEEIDRRRKAESRLRQAATHDGLTGAGNLRYFRERADDLLESARRNRKDFALLFIDLDRFKQVNDNHGHEAGDRLLMGLTQSIKKQLRKNDCLARLGGDEFVILIPDMSSLDNCRQLAQRVLQVVRAYAAKHAFSVTASIGISIYPSNGQDLIQIIRAADHAMFQAKKAGGNRFKFAEGIPVDRES